MDEYQQTLDYLYSFINFEQKALDRYQASKIDAERPRRLLDLLGAPQTSFPSIHIAGTKGKGSVAAMCASCLRTAGLRVGLYTSPHLREFRERIRVLTREDPDGRIPEQDFVDHMNRVRAVIEQVPGITWFEIVTAVAFLHFASAGVDVGVIEVGLGGRLDATNVLTPEVSVITSLSLDHTQLLGNTIGEIAFEKGGIIKPGVPVVSANQQPEALAVLEEIASDRGAPLTVVGRDWRYRAMRRRKNHHVHWSLRVGERKASDFIPSDAVFSIGLPGRHQVDNAAVALATLETVQPRFPALTLPFVYEGLASVQWEGRLQVIQEGRDRPTVLVDCAHNEDSAARLASALTSEYEYDQLVLVFGAPEDKNITGMMKRLLPVADRVIVTTANHPRSTAPERLADLAADYGRAATITHSVEEATLVALASASPRDLVCITGSIIVVGDLLNHWDTLQSEANLHG